MKGEADTDEDAKENEVVDDAFEVGTGGSEASKGIPAFGLEGKMGLKNAAHRRSHRRIPNFD